MSNNVCRFFRAEVRFHHFGYNENRSLQNLFREDNFVTYPLTKDSPFTKSIAITLERLRSHGIIDYIWRKHLPLIDKEKCKEPKVSSLNN